MNPGAMTLPVTSITRPRAGMVDVTPRDGQDAVPADGHIGSESIRPRAVDDRSANEDDIVGRRIARTDGHGHPSQEVSYPHRAELPDYRFSNGAWAIRP